MLLCINFRFQGRSKHYQSEMLSKKFSSEFSMKRDLIFLTDGSQFQPDPNIVMNDDSSDFKYRKSRMHYCQLINSKGTHVPNYVVESRICDSRCDCHDCSDEDKKICRDQNSQKSILDTKILGIRYSPTLEDLGRSGFWKIIKIPSNGSMSFRIPFMGGPHKQLQLNSIIVGSRGRNSNYI